MSLSSLTDRDAVEHAIAEFDSLGRYAFLRKHFFGPARVYYLFFRGRYYDSKAIAGVAHGYQHPDLGPLKSGDFTGGETTVATRLRSLGFEVIGLRPEDRAFRTWAFCANPKRYKILEAVRELDMDYWTVTRNDVNPGDQAIIWQTLNSDGHRGIVAFAEVIGTPEVRADESNPFWVAPNDGREPTSRVPVNYFVPDSLPLWVDETETGAFLQSLSVARARGGTVFVVTPQQWVRITTLAPFPQRAAQRDVEQQLRPRSSGATGQGYGLTALERQAVENHSMFLAMSYLRSEWASVSDVSVARSYDLHCSSGSDELRVEVKGTTTLGEQIVLTSNEVREARRQGYALFLVAEIELDRSDPTKPVASGGIARMFSPWAPADANLKPTSYACDIDLSLGVVVRPPNREPRT